MRYDNEYTDGLSSLSVHIFKEVYFSSCDHISCKAHKAGEGCIRFLGRLDWNSSCHGQHKAPIDIKIFSEAISPTAC